MSIHVIYYEGGAKKMRPILTGKNTGNFVTANTTKKLTKSTWFR